MQLNENTIKVLQNFSSIQDNLVVKEGDKLMTMAEARNVLAVATLDQSFDQDFGIYNLGEFLSVVNLVDDPTIKFNKDHMVITDSVGKSKVKYVYSDPSILTTPPSEPKFSDKEVDVSFTLDLATLNHIRKASAVFGYEKLALTPKDGNILVSVTDQNDPTSNSYSVELPGEAGEEPFNFLIDINNLKMIPGIYEVSLSRKLLSRFKSEDGNLTYFVALDKSSTYGE